MRYFQRFDRRFWVPWVIYTIVALLHTNCAQGPVEYFVSMDGAPGNPGTLDRPFSSLTVAQQAVREYLRESGVAPGGIRINLRGGIYPVEHTLHFSSEDAGIAEDPVVWQAYGEEEVILTGGQVVNNFQRVSDQDVLSRFQPPVRREILEADLTEFSHQLGSLKETGFGKDIRPTGLEVFYQGEPMILARYPDTTWLTVSSVPQTGTLKYAGDLANPGATFDGIPGGRHYGRFVLDDPRMKGWRVEEDIWMHGYWTWDWADMYERVGGFDLDKNEIYLSEPYHSYGIRKGQRFYFLNILEELDRPGEWYLDRDAAKLYFWPPGEIGQNDVLISLLESPMLKMDDVSYLQFVGMTFEATRGNAVEIRGGQSIFFGGCIFRNLGNYALWIEGGNHHTVQSCDIYHVGDGGIYVDGGVRQQLTPGNHQVNNCHIHHYSRVNRTGRPAITLKGVQNKLSHNYIHDAPHMVFGFTATNMCWNLMRFTTWLRRLGMWVLSILVAIGHAVATSFAIIIFITCTVLVCTE